MTILDRDAACIYSEGRWIYGHLHEQDGRITAIDGKQISGEPHAPYILPGFVDLHVHGGDGADVMKGAADVARMARFHAKYGTVALCPTTVTGPIEDISQALQGIALSMNQSDRNAATILGAHLEGPFVNSEKLGGQPPFAILPSLELTEQWTAAAPVRIVTLAPELPGAEAVTRFLVKRGVRVQIGHSLAGPEILVEAKAWGATGFAHLFNASAPIASRTPGVAGWALTNAQSVELICDLKHVHPDLLRLAIRAIPRPYFVSDCCAAGGCPDGDYHLGSNKVTKHDGLVCLFGTDRLAASLLVGIEAFRNILSLGCNLETAIEMTSARPAEYIGVTDFGAIALGRVASVIAISETFELTGVWLRGQKLQ